jgi:hypothetical protein
MLLHVLLLVVWTHDISAGFIRGQRYSPLVVKPEIMGDFSLPSRCLEDPDDEDCRRKFRELQRITIPTDTINLSARGGRNNNDASSSQPRSYVSDFNDYDQYVATAAPTKDMCYGNMARLNKKFCHSEMPSVSLEPSEQPTTYPGGGGWILWKCAFTICTVVYCFFRRTVWSTGGGTLFRTFHQWLPVVGNKCSCFCSIYQQCSWQP